MWVKLYFSHARRIIRKNTIHEPEAYSEVLGGGASTRTLIVALSGLFFVISITGVFSRGGRSSILKISKIELGMAKMKFFEFQGAVIIEEKKSQNDLV